MCDTFDYDSSDSYTYTPHFLSITDDMRINLSGLAYYRRSDKYPPWTIYLVYNGRASVALSYDTQEEMLAVWKTLDEYLRPTNTKKAPQDTPAGPETTDDR